MADGRSWDSASCAINGRPFLCVPQDVHRLLGAIKAITAAARLASARPDLAGPVIEALLDVAADYRTLKRSLPKTD